MEFAGQSPNCLLRDAKVQLNFAHRLLFPPRLRAMIARDIRSKVFYWCSPIQPLEKHSCGALRLRYILATRLSSVSNFRQESWGKVECVLAVHAIHRNL